MSILSQIKIFIFKAVSEACAYVCIYYFFYIAILKIFLIFSRKNSRTLIIGKLDIESTHSNVWMYDGNNTDLPNSKEGHINLTTIVITFTQSSECIMVRNSVAYFFFTLHFCQKQTLGMLPNEPSYSPSVWSWIYSHLLCNRGQKI